MKRGKRDKAEGALYKVGSRVLEAVGSLTGDRKKKVKGAWVGAKSLLRTVKAVSRVFLISSSRERCGRRTGNRSLGRLYSQAS